MTTTGKGSLYLFFFSRKVSFIITRPFIAELKGGTVTKKRSTYQLKKGSIEGEMKYFQKTSGNKFKAKRQDYNGKWYHSKGEAAYAQELDWLREAGEIKEWQGQVKVPLKVNGVLICNYYVDFKVITKHDTTQYHEYKGFETAEWKMKWQLFTALLDEIDPGAELIVIKHKSYYKPKF